MRRISAHSHFPLFEPNSYDAGVDEEDEPAEAKFSDDEEEKAYLHDQKRGETGASNSVSRPLISTAIVSFFARVSFRVLMRRTHSLVIIKT